MRAHIVCLYNKDKQLLRLKGDSELQLWSVHLVDETILHYIGTPPKGHPRNKDTSVSRTLCCVPNRLS